ncbi:MAG: helix-turn-helix domain-containing protein [Nitrincola lacisaponensis]|uniref:AraC family transcriptional regulator n=1 Tax=Nitrincola lacisaponensis TaxID=267850 RepID=UPI00391AA8B5
MVKQAEVISLPQSAEHHDHHHHQLVFGLEGATEFDIAGHTRPVSTGMGCLLPCETDHAFWGVGDNSIVVVNLAPVHADHQLQPRIDALFNQSRFIHCSSDLQVLIAALSREMQKNPDDALLQSACSNAIVCALQRHLEQQLAGYHRVRLPGKINMDVINNYIDLHIDRKIRVTELAGLVFLSSSQFFDRFRQQTGMTPQHYILNKRLKGAQEALETSDEPLILIASRFGFSNQSALTRAFTQYLNISPARYRKTNQFGSD